MHAALGPLFARMSRSREVTFVVDGQRYDVACAAGDTARVIEASLRCAVAARKVGGVDKIGDWERGGDCHGQWNRRSADGNDVYVNDNAERGVFRVLVCGTLLGSTFACPDAAREAADAYLVSQGRLDKSRAFVRLGEWNDDFSSYYRTEGGRPCHHAYSAAEKAKVDAELVASGALDPSRAFKAGPTSAPRVMGFTGVTGAVGSTYTIPTGYSAEHVASKINADPNAPVTAMVKHGAISLEQKAFGPAKPAWGEWERIGIAFVRRPSDRGAVPIAAYVDRWELGGNRQALATDIDDAREKVDASTAVVVNKRADGVNEVVGYARGIAKISDDEINATYGKHSEVARAMIGAKRRETRTVVHTVKNHGEAVTLANWEHHLPALLTNAPREFRDGFNRRQGPAWEAYLVALAGVKEEIQRRTLVRPATVEYVARVATFRAHGYLGPEWVKANVREPLVAQWDDIPSGGIRTLTIPVKVY